MIKGLIFDLDGTLLDSIDDIAQSMNDTLWEMGVAKHSLEEYKILIGTGIHDLAELVLPEGEQDPAQIERFVQRFREHYANNWKRNTKVFEGIMELLHILRVRGMRLAVLSNKSQRFTALMIDHWFQTENGEPIFEPVWGERPGFAIKPNPASSLEIARIWSLKPEEIAFVGDSEVDMQTAQNAGMLAVGVAWGFRTIEALRIGGAEYILNHPLDILKILD